MKRITTLDKILKPLSQQPTQVYLNNLVQVADVIEWALQQVPQPAEVWLTSFSISEEFVRRLYFISKDQKVTYNLVLDHKATVKTMKLWVFISEVVDNCYLADNHSKVLIVKGADGSTVTAITSQNLTRGNRNEAAMVTSDKNMCEELLASIQEIIQKYSVPLNELLGAAIGDD